MRCVLAFLGFCLVCLPLAAQTIAVRSLTALQAQGRRATAEERRSDAQGDPRNEPRSERQSEYLVRLAALPRGDIQASLALAAWCKKKQLFCEMRACLAPVLDEDPDQAEARALLGQLKVGAHWMPKAKAYRAMGYSYYNGAWRSPAEMRSLRSEAAQKRHRSKVRSDLGRLARILVGPDDKRSEKARDEFLAVVRREKLHRLGYEAEKAWYRARRFWKEHRGALVRDRVRGTIAMRAQMSQLLGFQNVTTSLGTGSPVTIQLPRTRSTGIGTTVPVGR